MRVREASELFLSAELAGCNADTCAAGRWTCHMLNGDFEKAWRESDSIAARGSIDPNRFWNGQPLEGRRVLIRCLHGLGDTIQFVRYAPLILEQSSFLILEVQPTLKELIQHSALADAVITWGEPEPAWDVQLEVIEIPRIFRTDLTTIPNRVPYLRAPQAGEILRPHSGALRVGMVWRSSKYNPARSVPAAIMAELFDIPGVEFYSLQAGQERFELGPWRDRAPSLFDEDRCVLAAASAVQALDLVITVDTMMAHLAGALGKPVWTLLPFQCDWRWMLERGDSPWYPTMRLFRQEHLGDWRAVMRRVKRELAALSQTGMPVRRTDACYQSAGPGRLK